MTPGERTACLLFMREKNLANTGKVKARGREGEHLYAITVARSMRWHFDPELVRRSALNEYVGNTPEGLGWKLQSLPSVQQEAVSRVAAHNREGLPPSPSPEIAAFLDIAPDPQKDVIRHGREAIKHLQYVRPSLRRPERLPLLRWVETMDTLTVHYLSKLGGGQLTREEAASRCGVDDRTFRYRLAKLRRWDLIGSARKPPVKLPVARN